MVQPKFYEATRILFVCQENKNNDFVLQFFSSSSHPPSLWRVHNVPLHVNKAQFYINSSSMCIRRGTLYNGGGQSRERRNHWIKTFFFFAYKKYSCSFVKLWLNHWCHMDYFNDVLTNFLSLHRGRNLAVYGRVRKLSDFLKNMLICVLKMNEGLTGLERYEGE